MQTKRNGNKLPEKQPTPSPFDDVEIIQSQCSGQINGDEPLSAKDRAWLVRSIKNFMLKGWEGTRNKRDSYMTQDNGKTLVLKIMKYNTKKDLIDFRIYDCPKQQVEWALSPLAKVA